MSLSIESLSVPALDLKTQYQTLREEIERAVREVIESQHFIGGPEVSGLESEVARYCSVGHGVGCASGSDALLLPLLALGDVAAFSFYPSKNLGGFGDGGMVTTDDESLAHRVARLRVHGMEPKYHHHEVGFNSRLDAIQAAVLRVKLRHLDAWTEGRRAV